MICFGLARGEVVGLLLEGLLKSIAGFGFWVKVIGERRLGLIMCPDNMDGTI